MTDTNAFVDAEYVAPKGGRGKPAEPNKYAGVIKEIALKTKKVGDKDIPVAKGEVLTHAPDDFARAKAVSVAKSRLSRAGADNDPKVTVMSHTTYPYVTKDAKGKETIHADKTLLSFWTVPRQTRTRKPVETTPEVAPSTSGE